jgi:ATP-dependent Lon protease
MALGGVRDEAEIRGHRKTYIGSMPGKVIQKISKAEASNPLFLLDEIDKMGMDMRGDPASALLEVLDPEQNSSFNDHYLEVDFDLSDVFFVCTSNSMNIPPALLDRMEVIRLPGYTEEEKLNIARRYLLPKQFENNGLEAKQVKMSDGAILDLIRHYTREAGVRNLEREIAKVTRKLVTEIALREKVLSKGARRRKQDGAIRISSKSIEKYNGVQRFKYGLADAEDRVGVVTGLAWTQVGGELLNIEAVAVSGKGKQIRTGSLGDVMQESIQAALTVVRSRSESLGIDLNYFDEHDVHVHVPEGATPKDGPSAGIGMCAALVSAVTDIPVRSDVAMTGEINLRGQVLPIGGLKEKLLAAHRGGIKRVLISEENEKDLKEIPSNVVANLEIIPVKWIEEVFELALVTSPKSIMPSRKKDTSEKRGGSRRKEMPKTESASTH